MRKIIRFEDNIPSFISWASVGGYEERRGPLGEKFDFCDDTDRFGMPTWELAEGEMGRISLNIAMNKISYEPGMIDALLAGDLENQCVASSGGLYSFGIPYIGLYSACSTCTEALLLLSSLISKTEISVGATVTTSHNSAAERQFRTPIEYGSQRTPTAQWTATASGAFILGNGGKVKIKNGIIKACEKRPVSMAKIDKLVSDIEKQVNNTLAQEISSKKVGELVMNGLKSLDDVAYVRFASVHRQFKDINTLLEEIEKLVVTKGEDGIK